jgi:ubiquinone/menaquinone biosynthesis C-methylase UbiE
MLMNEERRRFQPAEGILARTVMNEDDVIADLGCGTGYLTLPLLRQVRNVIAIDSQLGMLEDLTKRVGSDKRTGLNNILAELPDLPLKDGSMDHLFLINMMHEVEDRTKMVAECGRTLKKRGKVTLVDFQKRPTSMGPPLEERIREEDVGDIFIGFEITHTYSFPDFYQIELVKTV